MICFEKNYKLDWEKVKDNNYSPRKPHSFNGDKPGPTIEKYKNPEDYFMIFFEHTYVKKVI